MAQLDGNRIVDLPAEIGDRLSGMPWIHRIFLENLLRNRARDADAAAALDDWLGGGEPDISFYPHRLMMHDTTCGPALVDLAAMRTVVSQAGGNPALVSPRLRVDVSTDHSLAVDHFGSPAARQLNLETEMGRNAERFSFMKWAASTFDNFHVHPPGTGIMHTINIERLATVVAEADGWIFPDTLIGTDSHTPMVNGLGVLAWGVGGLEAESAMLGMPVMLKVPQVMGVYLTGALGPGVLATDLALTVTHLLRKRRLNDCFVEFFGPGVSGLTAGTRCVVANMAPEFGGATGFFPPDDQVLAYLRATGRSQALVDRVRRYAVHQQLWFDPQAVPEYDEVLNLDLGDVRPSLAGPHRPQDLLPRNRQEAKERQPVAIAAITSCTNTSDPRLLIAAGLLAQSAAARGLKVPPWVKTSLAPGSPTAATMLDRAGVLGDLEAVGFAIVGYGCTTCIGNSGKLVAEIDAMISDGAARPVAILSGNRNFPGRVHRDISDSYLASPPLVVAYALAGHFGGDIERDPLGADGNGRPVYLADIWPSDADIDRVLASAADAGDYETAYAAAEASAAWERLPAPRSALYPWDESSTYLRPPPFVRQGEGNRLGHYKAFPLLVLGDDITTDHISPAGSIPAESEAGRWLVAHGEDARDLNVYSSRRGNWEVMVRGLFTNPSVWNLLAPDIPPGFTLHGPTGRILPLWQAAELYRSGDDPVVVVAGERYGMGSSRDWAAKGQHLLGVRAVLARSFERIHRSNLINMGIVPIELQREFPGHISAMDRIEINLPPEMLAPRATVEITLHRGAEEYPVEGRVAVETGSEVDILRQGGVIPLILADAVWKAS